MESIEGVVVVGGGAVGLLTALILGKAGARVVVLESGPDVSPSSWPVAYTPSAIAVLERAGLLEDICKAAIRTDDVAYRHADGNLIARMEWNAVSEDREHPYMLLLAQHHVSGVIVEHLRRLPNVEIRWNHQVKGLEHDGSWVTLSKCTPGGDSELRARWVVGADGAQSTVRKHLGVSFDGITWPEQMVAVNVFYDFALNGYSRINFVHDPADAAAVIQLDQSGLWSVCYEEDRALSEAEILKRVPLRLARLLPGTPTPDQFRVERVRPYRVQQRCAGEFLRGRVILAGDAAHMANPMGGLSLSGGAVDAEHIALSLLTELNEAASDSAFEEALIAHRRRVLELISPTATPYLSWNSESDASRRAQDIALFEVAGNDRAVMRCFLLDFERINSRRPKSVMAWLKALPSTLRWSVRLAGQWLSRITIQPPLCVRNGCGTHITPQYFE
ncbi:MULTISPECIES: FAD-dependent oxidoreductase [Pseudomonas]|uniref:FAD-dependent oxidoreductase n=1 Tax=Pseudomonas TaxID=286 RepID=UPI00049AE10F|nr:MULTISPECIES: FAD-dependent monooxygenase [Pseudomonas]AHZ78072.1 monooxygenase, FAD-binding [Pseudomonas putida]MBP2839329.1 FAD-dependent monooxygenase [Pseudomonas sp. PNP]MCK2122727.1 FAD-dependent monooxygenase [Pseudomonas sp. PNPG3]QUN65188.1 FAD-dependent monooxygenase [Pseudomonas sp. JS425]